MGDTTNETLVFLNVFPTEVWRQVLDNVEVVPIYHKICASSLFFKDMPIPDHLKTKILFPSVVPKLVRYLKRSRAAYLEYLEIDEEEAEELSDFGHTFQARCNFTNILKIRHVCRDWKHGVDLLLENFGMPYLCSYDFDERPGRGCHRLWFDNFSAARDFELFQRYFDATNYASRDNPFVGKSVTLHVWQSGKNTDDPEIFMNASEQFLEKYGCHVLHCSFHVEIKSYQNLTRFYKWLCDSLERLPNIKTVSIHCSWSSIQQETKELALAELQQYAIQCPITRLQNLQFVKSSGDVEPFGVAIIKANTQIIKLQCSVAAGTEVLWELENLEQLGMELRFTKEEIKTNLEKLQMSPKFWDITKLDIISYREGVSWPLLFETIEKKFGSSLRHLRMYLPNKSLFNESLRLALPKVEILKVEGPFRTMDFILPMRNCLRELYVSMDSDISYEIEQQGNSLLRFFEYRFQLHRSNIWNMFPNLQKVQYWEDGMEKRSCSYREDWRDSDSSVTQ